MSGNDRPARIGVPEEAFGGRSWRPTRRTAGFLIGAIAIGGAFGYDLLRAPAGALPVLGWELTALDWLTLVAAWVGVVYGVDPALRRRRLLARHWRDLRGEYLALGSLGYLLVFGLVGLVGPSLAGEPSLTAGFSLPPAGVGVESGFVGTCLGGRLVDGVCYGTLKHPLGTTGGGRDVLAWLLRGARIALQVTVLTATILVPMAVAVGTVAAYVGGWVDEVLMRYVDLQQSIPPFFVYIVAQFVYGPSLALLIAVFGFLDWGGTARLVRSEAIQRSEEPYVLAARSAGQSRLGVLRHHVVPNVAATVLTAVTLKMPKLIVIEATLSFLNLGPRTGWSWGRLIAVGMQEFPTVWWSATFPVLALLLTVVSFNLLGDVLRELLDPRIT